MRLSYSQEDLEPTPYFLFFYCYRGLFTKTVKYISVALPWYFLSQNDSWAFPQKGISNLLLHPFPLRAPLWASTENFPAEKKVRSFVRMTGVEVYGHSMYLFDAGSAKRIGECSLFTTVNNVLIQKSTSKNKGLSSLS